MGKGDCDSNTSCLGELKCGSDNCLGEEFDETDDCCYDPRPASVTTTTEKPGIDIDCKAMGDLQEIIRNTRIARGCYADNATISLDTCSMISCHAQILKKSDACGFESEQMDCDSLEKVSVAIAAVIEQYCDGKPDETTNKSSPTTTATATATATATTTATTTINTSKKGYQWVLGNVFISCELVFSLVMFATLALVQVIPAAMEGIPAARPPIFAKKAKVIVTLTLTFTFR